MSRGVVVMLAYYYPPLVGAASSRAAGLSGCLKTLGWDPIVVSPREGFFLRSTMKPPEGVEVVATSSLELSRVLRRVYASLGGARLETESGGIAPLPSGRLRDLVRQLLRDFLYLPDAQVGWIPFAVRAAARALAEHGGRRAIHSSSGPYSAHLAAMWVARRLGVPWLAEFRDPWTTMDDSIRTTSRWRKGVDRRIERRIVTRADAIVLTTEAACERLLAEFPEVPREKVHVVLSGFDPRAAGHPPEPKQAMSILYAGTLYPGDDMEPLLRALDAVHAREPGAIRLRVAGPAAEWERYRAARPGREAWLELLGLLPQDRAEAEMADSSVLLLFRTNPALTSQQVAGKIFAYIATRRPILAVLAPGSEMEALLRRHADARVVHEYTAARIEAAVVELLAAHKAGLLAAPRLSAEAIRPLERIEQARRLADVLAAITEPK